MLGVTELMHLMIRFGFALFVVAVVVGFSVSNLYAVVDSSCWTNTRVDLENLCLTEIERYTGACDFPVKGTVHIENCIDKVIFFNHDELDSVLNENRFVNNADHGCVENVKSHILRTPRAGIQSKEALDKLTEMVNSHPACMNFAKTTFEGGRLELFGPEGAGQKIYCLVVDKIVDEKGERFKIDAQEVSSEKECV